jgi:TusA-related sulfurtransferase
MIFAPSSLFASEGSETPVAENPTPEVDNQNTRDIGENPTTSSENGESLEIATTNTEVNNQNTRDIGETPTASSKNGESLEIETTNTEVNNQNTRDIGETPTASSEDGESLEVTTTNTEVDNQNTEDIKDNIVLQLFDKVFKLEESLNTYLNEKINQTTQKIEEISEKLGITLTNLKNAGFFFVKDEETGELFLYNKESLGAPNSGPSLENIEEMNKEEFQTMEECSLGGGAEV